MKTLKLLTDFWKEAAFDDFNTMMNVVLPHTGESYRLDKFYKFRDNLSAWLCELTTNNLEKFEAYLFGVEQRDTPVLPESVAMRIEKKLQGYRKDTLTTYMAVMVDENRHDSLFQNLDGIEELLTFSQKTETGSDDLDSAAPASLTDELN